MPSTPSDAASDLSALRLLNEQYIRAVAESNAAWFDQHLSSDFVNSNPDGTLSDRAAFLRRVAGPSGVSNFAVEDVRIRLFGDAALVHGRTTYVTADGAAGAGRYTDVWARIDGAWRCVGADVTRC